MKNKVPALKLTITEDKTLDNLAAICLGRTDEFASVAISCQLLKKKNPRVRKKVSKSVKGE